MNDLSRKRTLTAKVGVGICLYEGAALALGQPDRLPPITHLSHRWWPVAVFCSGWTAHHLLRPWASKAASRVR